MATDAVLALDIGTTNWKAGVFRSSEAPLLRSTPTKIRTDAQNLPVYDPEELWQAVCELINGFPAEVLRRVTQIGVTGMAEAGLLLDRRTMQPLCPILPWSDRRGVPHLGAVDDRFLQTGLPKHSKYSLFKVLALAQDHSLADTLWLGVPEYVVYRLTGVQQTDPTLAARTYAYHVPNGQWDTDCLDALGLPHDLFPPVQPTGAAAGVVTGLNGLADGVTAAVCGHDHLAAAHALNALNADSVFVSAGTAQVMLGFLPNAALTETEHLSGLSYGPSPTGEPGWVCLGSIQSAGGSVNHWRTWLGLSHEDWWRLAAHPASASHTELLYLPYLAGSGAPHLDPLASGALLGLRQEHSQAHVVRGITEGIAFETRWILERMGLSGRSLTAAGGLSRREPYMQTLANALGQPVNCPACEEATLEGAAMLACGERLNPVPTARRFVPAADPSPWQRQYQRFCSFSETVLNMERKLHDHENVSLA